MSKPFFSDEMIFAHLEIWKQARELNDKVRTFDGC